MAINQTLKFSWGHIVAFIAMILISYITFIGTTYLTDGHFLYAGMAVFAIDIILMVLFIMPQMLKGTDEKFSKRIVTERVLIFTAPVFYILIMIPFVHFWSVFDNRSQIESSFSQAIATTKGMFVSYEEYATNRISEYENMFNKVEDEAEEVVVKPSRRKKAKKSVVKKVRSQKEIADHALRVEALRLQLLGQNYITLKTTAHDWVDEASGATVWNVFMIGNIDEIEAAVDCWNLALNSLSSKKMSNEPATVEPFSLSDANAQASKENLNAFRSVYTTMESPTVLAIINTILLYIMLMFPYVIQSRNTKSTFNLWGSERKLSAAKSKKHRKQTSSDEISSLSIDDTTSSNDDNYDSFTI